MKKSKISVVAIFGSLGDIDIQRGFNKPITYKMTWNRAARLRNVILMGYEYSAFCTVDFEKYSIKKELLNKYH